MHSAVFRRELLLVTLLFAFGFFVLPLAVYWVGQEVIGDYTADAGVFSLAESIWADLLHFRAAPWLLVLSPYGVIQLLRLARRIWRAQYV